MQSTLFCPSLYSHTFSKVIKLYFALYIVQETDSDGFSLWAIEPFTSYVVIGRCACVHMDIPFILCSDPVIHMFVHYVNIDIGINELVCIGHRTTSVWQDTCASAHCVNSP